MREAGTDKGGNSDSRDVCVWRNAWVREDREMEMHEAICV